MWPPQPGQACRAGTSTRSRSGRGRADTLAIPRLQEIQPLQRSTPASFAGLEKKRLRAAEQDRPDVAEARRAWAPMRSGLAPSRLVFLDETWAATNMARRYG